MSNSFNRMATVTASTKRATLSSGKRGAPATYLASLACTPLDPADPSMRAEIQQRFKLQTPVELLQTFVDGSLDIKEGDVLVVSTVEYPVRSAAEWMFRGSRYLHLMVEELKR